MSDLVGNPRLVFSLHGSLYGFWRLRALNTYIFPDFESGLVVDHWTPNGRVLGSNPELSQSCA